MKNIKESFITLILSTWEGGGAEMVTSLKGPINSYLNIKDPLDDNCIGKTGIPLIHHHHYCYESMASQALKMSSWCPHETHGAL